MLASALAGLGLGLSLIVAIGPQGLFVLRQGLRREHAFAVALVCTASDVLLISLGVSGVGLVVQTLPWVLPTVRVGGAVFLLGYAALALRRALAPAVPSPPTGGTDRSQRGATRGARTSVLVACLALTWLNPHVYLDTVFLLGSVANTHTVNRWWFALGTLMASALWFFGLAFGARLLGRWLATPRAWRMMDGAVATVMAGLSAQLTFAA